MSLLNRTAQVRPDGSWRIDNVPANLGRVRVRATCVKDGVTVSGQSDYFVVRANAVNGFDAEIVLGKPEDFVPESLSITAPVETLTAMRRSAQLAATARFAGGTTADVTAFSTGTTWAVSNPDVVSISPEGLVTARRSGTVLVSATKDGALGVLRLTVVLSPDGDGDGIPDETEVAEGLDPGNPLDALFDLDGDSLSNREEFGLGTRIRVADHDGDGIGDGEEVRAGRDSFVTNPLLRDTDDDVVPDGLEVRLGTDPSNAASVDLAAALSGIVAQPAQVQLVFNTALGRDVSQRVKILGTLVDRSTADLTARSVAYASSDLAVASFGAEPGRIFAGRDGSAKVTATLGRFQSTVAVTVRTFAPTPLSFLPLPGFANGVDVDGRFAYVASGAAGLCIVDISDLAAPVLVATIDTPGNANDVRVLEGLAYVADGAAGLVVVDVRAPSRARIAGVLDTPGEATDVAVREGVAYIADGGSGLMVADVQNPEAPVLLGLTDTPGRAQGIDLSGSFAVVADGYGGVQVINVSNPRRPRLAGTAPTRSRPPSYAADIAVRGQLAYVADGAEGNLGGLRVIDLRVPEAPVVVASTSNAFGLPGVALDRDLAVAADFFFANAVPLFDLEVPALVPRGVLNLVPFSGRDDNGNGIAVRDGVLFLAAVRKVIADNGVSGDSGLYIGRYALLEDTAGVPPTVRITAPVAETAARERTVLRLAAEAADDFGVAEVRFLVDGEAVFADSRPPYMFDLVVPIGRNSLAIGAEVLDPGGNLGTAETVEVAVEPDDSPAVRLLAPADGRSAPVGTLLPVVAEASDDRAVTSVRFLIDGVPWATDTEAPFRAQLPLARSGTTLTLTAEATDSVGQTAVSAPVSVTVGPDSPPAVELFAPAAGARAVAGTTLEVMAGAADDLGVAAVQLST